MGSSKHPFGAGSYASNPPDSACFSASIVTVFSSQSRVLRVRSSAVRPLMRSRISSPREYGFTTLSNGRQVWASARALDPTQSIVNSSAPSARHHSTSRHVSAVEKSAGARYRLTRVKFLEFGLLPSGKSACYVASKSVRDAANKTSCYAASTGSCDRDCFAASMNPPPRTRSPS